MRFARCRRLHALARLLHDNRDRRALKLREVMARPLPEADEHMSLDEVYHLLMSGSTGVLVRRAGKIAGILTRIDLVEFCSLNSELIMVWVSCIL